MNITVILTVFFGLLPFQIALGGENVDLASARLIAVGIFLVWIAAGLLRRRLFIAMTPALVAILFLVFWSALSLVWGEERAWGVRKVLFLLSFLPLIWVIADQAQLLRSRRAIFWGIAIGGSVSAVIGLAAFSAQFFVGGDRVAALWHYVTALFIGNASSGVIAQYSSWYVHVGGRDILRATAFFPDPHMAAFYAEMTVGLALGLYHASRTPAYRFWALMMVLVGVLFIGVTFTRGAYIGLVCASVVAVVLWCRRLSSSLGIVLFVMITVVVSGVPLVSDRMMSSFSREDGSVNERLMLFERALDAIAERPFTGYGIGNGALALVPTAAYRDPVSAHNLYLDLALDGGLLAVFLWMIVLLDTTQNLWRKRRDDALFAGALVGLVAVSIHALFDLPFFSVHVLPLIVCVIAFGAAARYAEKQHNPLP